MHKKGNIMKTLRGQKKLAACILGISFIMFFVCHQTAFAGRSGAGGGDIAEFSVGKWAAGTAIGAMSSIGGQYASGLISGTSDNFSFGNAFSNWGDNFTSNMASNQIGRAVGAMGQYYEWGPTATIITSSVARGAIMTGIDSDSFTGVGIGAIKGAASGAVMASMANKNGEVSPAAGFLGGMAGDLAGGFVGGGFSAEGGLSNMTHNIAAGALSMGIGYATQGIENRQDRYIAEQAATGLYPILGATMSTVAYGKEDKNGVDNLDRAFGVDAETRRNLDLYFNGRAYMGPNYLNTQPTSSYGQSQPVQNFQQQPWNTGVINTK